MYKEWEWGGRGDSFCSPAAEQFTHRSFSDRHRIVDGAAERVWRKMTCWPVPSCVSRRAGSRVRGGQEKTGGASGGMFSWILKGVKWRFYMFSRVDISVDFLWREIRDFKRLSKSVFLSNFSQGSTFDWVWNRICTRVYQDERQTKWKKNKEKTPKHTAMCDSSQWPATPRWGCAAHSPATPFIKLDRERESECEEKKEEEPRSKQRLRGER